MKSNVFCLGIDTSNYTTSAALVGGDRNIAADARRVLEVKQGERGLRQSQALFEHIGQLPEVFEELFRQAEQVPGFEREKICCVAVSDRPRPVEGSYMPVFQAGISHGEAIAKTLGVPCFRFSHQEGHLAAVLPENGMGESPFLALHLSGGTTEVLWCRKESGEKGPTFEIRIAGGTKDLSYGQVIDRVGVAMGLGFPCGREMDRAALEWDGEVPDFSRIPCKEGRINLSGIETQIQRYVAHYPEEERGDLRGPVAKALLDRIGDSLQEMIRQCRELTGLVPVLVGGGVASSRYLRNKLEQDPDICFGPAALSSDNAVGTAMLGMERWIKQRGSV